MWHFVSKGRTTRPYIGRHFIHYLLSGWSWVVVTAHFKGSMWPSVVIPSTECTCNLTAPRLGCDSISLPMLLHDFTNPANGPAP